ncbi:MAG TPA: alpha-galactosidase [Spirochaetota bacterium]|nr:alpha-galactosidase [Spirochaetota bacterium]
MNKTDLPKYDILWDDININPSVQLKFGIKRRLLPLSRQFTNSRSTLYYVNEFVELSGKWDNSPGFGSLLSLKLKNIYKKSIRIARLVFPAENGLDNYLNNFNSKDISFLRNGYQSWSTSRSYRVKDKPLRPWLQLVSLASSNLSNLPSNTSGNLSSEMFSVITDLKKSDSFLIGQSAPFNQFFYIRLILHKRESKTNYFELVFDFGRKMMKPNQTINLDGILMAKGDTLDIQSHYFKYIKEKMNIKTLKENIKGWSSWYYYYNKISPKDIYQNMKAIKNHSLDINLIQIDDGYQKFVGDWLDLTPQFSGKMKEIAGRIRDEGYTPGIWLAPFIADKNSYLAKNFPNYILRTDWGKPILGGYNPVWPGKFYYALDITNPRFEEYIREVVWTFTREWGFKYLKLDFLYGGCMRGGNHNDIAYSRAEALKRGVKIIKETAGPDTILSGCGAPLSSCIGLVDAMRVGPDTAAYWKKLVGTFLQTGAMIGARNSMRNFIVRSFMHNNLWLNDPDCIMVREQKTKLTRNEKTTQINAIILSGGTLIYSDNFAELSEKDFHLIKLIGSISDECFAGDSIPIDIMERELPEIYYNTAGYIGIFNFLSIDRDKQVNFSKITHNNKRITKLTDVWSLEVVDVTDGEHVFKKMPKRSSRLFRIIG